MTAQHHVTANDRNRPKSDKKLVHTVYSLGFCTVCIFSHTDAAKLLNNHVVVIMNVIFYAN